MEQMATGRNLGGRARLGLWLGCLGALSVLSSCFLGHAAAPIVPSQQDDELREAQYPQRYPVEALMEGNWQDLVPLLQHVSLWNGRIVRADKEVAQFLDLNRASITRVDFPEDGSEFRPLRTYSKGPFHPPATLDFPGYEYTEGSGGKARDRVVFVNPQGERQSSFVVQSRWGTSLSPQAEVLVKYGAEGLFVIEGMEIQNVAGFAVYRRDGSLLCETGRQTRLFFMDVNDRGYTAAIERQRDADVPQHQMGPGTEEENLVTGFALLDPSCKVILRRPAARVDQLLFTVSGDRLVAGLVDFNAASQRYRRRTDIFDLQGTPQGGLEEMTGMLFGQSARGNHVVFTRAGLDGQPWRWTEVAFYDAGTSQMLRRFQVDVNALTAHSLLTGEKYLFVYFDPYQDRLAPYLLVFDIVEGRQLFGGAWFESPSTLHFTFKDYGDGEHVLFASPKRLWITSGKIVENFAQRTK